MIIEISDDAKKAIEHIVQVEDIPNPQVCVYGSPNSEEEFIYEMVLVNGIPHEEDITFNFDTFVVSLNSTYRRTMLGTYLIDFNEYPFSAFTIEKTSEVNE